MYRSFRLLSGKYDIENYKASVFPTYPGIAYVNRHKVPGAKVLLVGEARNYYLKLPYYVSSGLDYSIVKKYLKITDNAEDFVKALKKDKIVYIILNLGEFNRLQREYKVLDEGDWEKMGLYLQNLNSMKVFQKKGIFVFKL